MPSHRGPFRIQRQQAASPLQREVAGRHSGGSGHLTPARRRIECGAQLVQPSMGVVGRLGCQAAQFGSGSLGNRPLLAQEALARPPGRDGQRIDRHAPQPGPLLSSEGAWARGGGSDIPPGASWPSESHSAVDAANQPAASRRYTPIPRTTSNRTAARTTGRAQRYTLALPSREKIKP